MTQQIYRTTVGNTSPSIQVVVKRNGVVIDLTSATNVDLAIRRESTGLTTNTGHQSCTITTAASGIVTYTPQAGDFSFEGRYLGDVKVTFSGGGIEHIYELLLVLARPGIS